MSFGPRSATSKGSGSSRSKPDRGSPPKNDTAERAAQQRYRAKIHDLLEELQRLVRPPEEIVSGKTLRRGQLSKTTILTCAIKIVEQILLDDDVLKIAKKIEAKQSKQSHKHSNLSQVQMQTQPRPSLEAFSHTEKSFNCHAPNYWPGIEEESVRHSGQDTRYEQHSVSLSGVVLDQPKNRNSSLESSSTAARSSQKPDPDPHFFLRNWVSTLSPTDEDGNENVVPARRDLYSLVDDLDNPEDNIPHALLSYFNRPSSMSRFNQ